MPGSTLARGNIVTNAVMQIFMTPVAVANSSTVEQNFTIPGLLSTDQVSAIAFQGAYTVNVAPVNFRVAANNVLTVAYQNTTGAPVTPPSGNYLVEINRVELSTIPANMV